MAGVTAQGKKACSVAWGGFKIQASAADMCGWSHSESFRLSISNLAYSEPGSPFPDCREELSDRLSSSVLLPGIEPRTGRKRDPAITTELIPAPNHRERRGKERNACSCLFSKPFSNRPHTQNFTDLPVSPAMATCRQQSVCPSG